MTDKTSDMTNKRHDRQNMNYTRQTLNVNRQYAFGFDYMQDKGGLQDLNTYPEVAHHDHTNAHRSRVKQHEAFGWPFINFGDTGGTQALLGYRCQNIGHAEKALDELKRRYGLQPNWTVRTPKWLYVAFSLKNPVAKHRNAQRRIIGRMMTISEWLQQHLQADPHYTGLDASPAHNDNKPGVIWHNPNPHTLKSLAQPVPKGWKRPKLIRSIAARNLQLFMSALDWAGRRENLNTPVIDAITSIHRDQTRDDHPGFSEYTLNSMAERIEGYRQEWEAEGWHNEKFRKRQSDRGRKGGKTGKNGATKINAARQATNIERNAMIIEAKNSGLNAAQIARAFGLSRTQTYEILRAEKVQSETQTEIDFNTTLDESGS